jgi:predicted dehydrogenase/threonine dehydrogenase-like Zn-dependent dehydrogenase
MKQLLHNFESGNTYLEEIPVPALKKGHLLIQTSYSLVSLGTERMLVEFGQANLINKVRQQPDKVKTVIDKLQTDGVIPTLKAVKNKLSTPIPLGYCNVGKVIGVGNDVQGFEEGDIVVSNGNHAEIVCVPKNLCAKVPKNVSQKEAAFTVLCSIALQGIRLADPKIGDTVAVLGLGLIGQITVQILKANGCKVLGVDIDNEKIDLCKNWGIDTVNSSETNVVEYINSKTNSHGVDSVLITAASQSHDIISNAANICRKQGSVVVVGFVGLNLKRDEFYEKEITLQVSCSYGPGRYDADYEQGGNDYPYHYVRWTEQRNFEAILDLMSRKSLFTDPLISRVVKLDKVIDIYDNISKDHSLATLIEYKAEVAKQEKIIQVNESHDSIAKVNIGIIGAGNYTKSVILPQINSTTANLEYIACRSGINSKILAKSFKIKKTTTDYSNILKDKDVDLVIISTRHDSHSKIVIESLKSGKHVFVEKPLAINHLQLEEIIEAKSKYNRMINVGYNRRFSPHAQKIKSVISNQSTPINIVATMNAGFIDPNDWVHDLKLGGGRIIGEACHYFDLLIYLTGSKIKSVCSNFLDINELKDNASILLKFENGSNGVINYFSNGPKNYVKEEIKVFSQQKVFLINNFTKTSGYGFNFGQFRTLRTSQDKGQKNQFSELINSISKGNPIIPFEEIINSAQASLKSLDSFNQKKWIDL